MRIIIAGSRDFNDFVLLERECIEILGQLTMEDYDTTRPSITIVSGKAPGADTLGEKYAEKYNLKVEGKPADWSNLNVKPCVVKRNRFGKKYNSMAGHIRNEEMAKFAAEDPELGVLIAFWDGKSPGTKGMIELAEKYKLRTFVIRFEVNKMVIYNAKLYADGASSNNQDPEKRVGGTGVVLRTTVGDQLFKKELSNTYPGWTNNRAELQAILEGLQAIKPQFRKETAIEVISDSKNAVQTFNDWIEGWKKRGWKKSDKKTTPENLDIIQAIDAIRKEFAQVTFRHVPSCKGDNSTEDKEFNNRADELASIAAGSRGN